MTSNRLAIDGGTPVRDTLLPYGRQVVDESDIESVVEVLRGDWLTTGPAVGAYEGAVAKCVGARHGVAMSSGTAGLHGALASLGVGQGDEVITSPLTFAASANCALYCGATPVFADIDPDTCNLDPEAVADKVTERTRAIVVVHYGGQPADLDELRAIASRSGTAIVEDAAHALGATYRDRAIGGISPLTVFSTHPVKPITTAEGGVVTTNDEERAAWLRAFRTHGVSVDAHERAARGDWVYEMQFLGYNYRIPDVLCALGLSQMDKLDTFLARRRTVAAKYDKAFAEMPGIEPIAQRNDRESAWHLYVIRLRLERLRADRKQVFRALRAEGIGVNVHYIPVYWHPYYASLGYAKGLCPVAETEYERLVTLPLWAGMTDEDVDDVVEAVRKVVGAYEG